MLPSNSGTYPGTPRHQRALRAITERYAAVADGRAALSNEQHALLRGVRERQALLDAN